MIFVIFPSRNGKSNEETLVDELEQMLLSPSPDAYERIILASSPDFMKEKFREACCPDLGKGRKQGAKEESFIKRNFRKYLETIIAALKEHDESAKRAYEKVRLLCFKALPLRIQRYLLDQVTDFLLSRDPFLLKKIRIPDLKYPLRNDKNSFRELIMQIFADAVTHWSSDFLEIKLLIDIFPTFEIFQRFKPANHEFKDMSKQESDYLITLQAFVDQAKPDMIYREPDVATAEKNLLRCMMSFFELHEEINNPLANTQPGQILREAGEFFYRLLLQTYVLLDYLTIMGYRPFEDSVITEDTFLKILESFDKPWDLHRSKIIKRLEAFLENSRQRAPDFDEQQRLALAIDVACSSRSVNDALNEYFPIRNFGSVLAEPVQRAVTQTSLSAIRSPKETFRKTVQDKFPELPKAEAEDLIGKLLLLHKKFQTPVEDLISMIQDATSASSLQGKVEQWVEEREKSSGKGSLNLNPGQRLAAGEVHLFLPETGSALFLDFLQSLTEAEQREVIDRLKRLKTTAKSSDKNQVFELEIVKAGVVIFYNYSGPNNALVILGGCRMEDRTSSAKSLKKMLEKLSLQQLYTERLVRRSLDSLTPYLH